MWLIFMRVHHRVLAKKIVDERSLARVQQQRRELMKVTERPKQINTVPKGGFSGC